MKNSKFNKLFKLIMQEYANYDIQLNKKYGEDNNINCPEFVPLSEANIVDITKQMFDYVGIDTSKPVYAAAGYSAETANDPSNKYKNKLYYTGNFIKITNDLTSAENESNEIQTVIIDDDGNAIINVSFENDIFSKAHILYDLHDHEIRIFVIK